MTTIALDDHQLPAMDPGEIVEKHMRELKSALANMVANATSEHVQRNQLYKKDLEDSKTIIDYLRRQNRETENELAALRDMLNMERDEHSRDLEVIKTLDRRIVCLIDGDGSIFSLAQVARGQIGGHDVAARLMEGIQEYFGKSEPFQLHVWVFFNKSGLSEAMKRHGRDDARANLDYFVHGFNQAAGRFMMVDIGYGKEVADAKIRACLEDEVKALQTVRVIFSGCHDNGYLATLRPLITSGFKNKLVLMPGYKDMAAGFASLDLPTLIIPDLFEPEKLGSAATSNGVATGPPGFAASSTKQSSPILPSSPPAKTPTSYISAVQSPSSPVHTPGHLRRSSPPARRPRHIDPNKPLSKQEPPPCNLFYLTNYCKHNDKCVFAHDYLLKPEHLEEMRENAKKSVCPALNRGEICPYGDECVLGHKCPYSPRCHYYKIGVCKFTGPGMHSTE